MVMDNYNLEAATVSDTFKSRSLKKVNRKSSRSTLRSTATYKKSANQKRMAQALAKEFLAYRVSAAGVSYIVNSRSRARRWLWLVAVILSFSFMGYMTIKVILEYLGYPKSLVREGEIATKLSFPAVTVCSLNPLLNNYIENTTVAKFLKLRSVLERATNVQTDTTLRDKCYLDPLCQWSWFSEQCNCVENPCLTEFCLPANSSHCVCSFVFCRDSARFWTCSSPPDDPRKSPPCFCSDAAVYKSWAETPVEGGIGMCGDMEEAFHDEDVQDIVKLIRNTETYDLAEIEDAMLPTTNDLFDYGINFDNMVISCSFEGSRCYRENFTVLYHPKYGKCYMFNFLGSGALPSEEPLDIYNYGSSSGLQLILHVTEKQAVNLLNDEVGVRVVVHDPRDLPFVAEYGVNVRPRDMSAVEVTLSSIERLGAPWGDCEPEENPIKYDKAQSLYTILGCEKMCRHRHLTRNCGCSSRQFLRGSVFLKVRESSNDFCNISNTTENKCMNDVISDIETNKVSCVCKPPCKETIYSYTVSSSQLNENFYRAVKAIRTLKSHAKGQHSITNTTEDSTAMVGLKVYYSTFEVGNDKEVATYSWETMVANVGGNLGFFMGLTLVTFVELFEFLWDLLLNAFKRPGEVDHRGGNKIYTFSKKT